LKEHEELPLGLPRHDIRRNKYKADLEALRIDKLNIILEAQLHEY